MTDGEDDYEGLDDRDELAVYHTIPMEAPDPLTILSTFEQRRPAWLNADINFDQRTLTRFFKERTSFYPGAGTDGQLFAIFGKSKTVHCHVHADFSVSAEEVLSALKGDYGEGLYGYEVCKSKILSPTTLGPFAKPPLVDWDSNLDSSLIVLLRRWDDFADSHGPEFQCFLHIQADAYWTYWNLWAQKGLSPYAMILQDHGFGGNHGGLSFGGANSLFLEFANEATMPEFLLVGESSESWPGYQLVAGWAPVSKKRPDRRCLYQKI